MKKWKCILGGLMLLPVLISWTTSYIKYIYLTIIDVIEKGWLGFGLLALATVYTILAFYLIYKCLENKRVDKC